MSNTEIKSEPKISTLEIAELLNVCHGDIMCDLHIALSTYEEDEIPHIETLGCECEGGYWWCHEIGLELLNMVVNDRKYDSDNVKRVTERWLKIEANNTKIGVSDFDS